MLWSIHHSATFKLTDIQDRLWQNCTALIQQQIYWWYSTTVLSFVTHYSKKQSNRQNICGWKILCAHSKKIKKTRNAINGLVFLFISFHILCLSIKKVSQQSPSLPQVYHSSLDIPWGTCAVFRVWVSKRCPCQREGEIQDILCMAVHRM